MKIFLIRHGQSEANAKGIHQGQKINSSLSKKGREQAKRIAERLKDEKIEAVYSSDLKRAMETAEEIARFHNLKVLPDKRLREYDTGDWTERDDKWEIWERYKEEQKKKLGVDGWKIKMPGGESGEDHILRVKAFLKDILHHKQDIAVIAHGGTNKIFFGVIEYLPMDKIYEQKQLNACVNELEFKDGKWIVHRINCIKHLEE